MKQDNVIFNLLIIQYYMSEVRDFIGSKKTKCLVIDEYWYELYLQIPTIRALISAFPVNEYCVIRMPFGTCPTDENFQRCNVVYIKD